MLHGEADTWAVVVVDAPAGPASSFTASAGAFEWPVPGGIEAAATSGRVAFDGAGEIRIRIRANLQPAFSGPYRFWSYAVSESTETRDQAILLSAEIAGESIERSGDLDVFTFSIAPGEQFHAYLQSARLLTMAIYTPAGAPVGLITSSPTDTSLFGRGVGPFALPQGGTFRAVISGGSAVADTGAYRLYIQSLASGTEVAGDTIAIGDTVSIETIASAGDYDVFVFHGTRREQVNVKLQGAGVRALLSGERAAVDPLAEVSSVALMPSLDGRQAVRIELPYTGWYRLAVSGDPGSYAFAAVPVGVGPETASGALTVGDSVGNESIDARGDMDEFILSGTPGSEVSVLFSSPAPVNGGVFPRLQIYNPETGDSMAIEAAQSLRIAGPVRIPSGGSVVLSVYDEPFQRFMQCDDAECSDMFFYQGGYTIKVVPLVRAPENTPPNFIVGDTVRGEGISPLGDIDEFTASGQHLNAPMRVGIRLTQDPLPAGGGLAGGKLTIDIVDPVTREVLLFGTHVFVATPNFVVIELPFFVPPGGAFLVRIRGSGGYGADLGTAPYEFVIMPGGSGQITQRGNERVQLRR